MPPWTLSDSTLLTIEAQGLLTPYSARGLKQSFKVIDEAKRIRRNVDGIARDLSREEFRKYETTITGHDVDPPAIAPNHYVGMIIRVGWIHEFAVAFSGGPPSPLELPSDSSPSGMVPGSLRFADGFLFYRPLRVMMITDFDGSFEEWPHNYDWTLSAVDV